MGWLVGFVAKSALMSSPIGAALKLVPGKVWLWLAILVAVAAAFFLHQHIAGTRLQARYDAGYAQGQLDAAKAQRAAQATANAAANAINSTIRKNADEEAIHIARDADDVRLRGPGKAVCPRPAASSGPASGHDARSRTGDAAVAAMPDPERSDLIAVPFADLIDFAERADRNRSEVNAWRESDRQQGELAKKSQPKELDQ